MNKSRKYILAERVDDSQKCFCCGKDKNNRFEKHHFPRSHSAGGELYVPLCGMCHDTVDRYPLQDWPEHLLSEVSDKLIDNWRVLELMCGFAAILHEKEEEEDGGCGLHDNPIDVVLNLTEEQAWEIIETCDGSMRLLAMKVISMCFSEQQCRRLSPPTTISV